MMRVLYGSFAVAYVVATTATASAGPVRPRVDASRGAAVLSNGKTIPVSGAYFFAPNTAKRGRGVVPAANVGTMPNVTDTIVNRSVTGDFPANEPAVAVDPNDPSHVLASANDYRFGDSETGFYSSLAGAGFTDTVEQYVESEPSYYNASGDPSAGIDRLGIDYLGTLAFDRLDNRSSVLVGHSFPADRGRFVAAPPTVVDQQSATSSTFDDKDSLGVDVVDKSPYEGSVYSAFTQFTATSSPIVAAYSRDHAVSFSHPVLVSKPGSTALCPFDAGACADDQGSAFAIGPHGVVYVAYENFDTPSLANQILIAASHDGGATFGAPVRVATVNDITNPSKTFRVDSFPNIAIDRTTGRLYVVWADERSGSPEIDIATSSNGTVGSWSAPKTASVPLLGAFRFFPAVAVATNTGDVFVSYYDNARFVGSDTCDYVYRRFSANLKTATPVTRVSHAPIFPDVDFNGTFFGDYTSAAPTPDGALFVWTGTASGKQDIEIASVR